MRLIYEHPYEHASKRKFPLDVGYMCVEPSCNASISELLALVNSILGDVVPISIAPLRPYRECILAARFDLGTSTSLIQGVDAEGWAIVPGVTSDELAEVLSNPSHADEAAVVNVYHSRVVAFLHEGHPNVEFVGSPPRLWSCLVAWAGKKG